MILLADNIRTLRKKFGMSQAKLAKILSVTQGAVSQWQLGTSQPGSEQLIAIAECFHCSVDDLIRGDEQDISQNSISPCFSEFYDVYSKLSSDQQQHIQQYMRFVISENENKKGAD